MNPVEGNQNAVIFVNSDVSHEQGAEDLKELRDFISEVSLFDTMINLYTESPNYFTAFNAFIAGPLRCERLEVPDSGCQIDRVPFALYQQIPSRAFRSELLHRISPDRRHSLRRRLH